MRNITQSTTYNHKFISNCTSDKQHPQAVSRNENSQKFIPPAMQAAIFNKGQCNDQSFEIRKSRNNPAITCIQQIPLCTSGHEPTCSRIQYNLSCWLFMRQLYKSKPTMKRLLQKLFGYRLITENITKVDCKMKRIPCPRDHEYCRKIKRLSSMMKIYKQSQLNSQMMNMDKVNPRLANYMHNVMEHSNWHNAIYKIDFYNNNDLPYIDEFLDPFNLTYVLGLLVDSQELNEDERTFLMNFLKASAFLNLNELLDLLKLLHLAGVLPSSALDFLMDLMKSLGLPVDPSARNKFKQAVHLMRQLMEKKFLRTKKPPIPLYRHKWHGSSLSSPQQRRRSSNYDNAEDVELAIDEEEQYERYSTQDLNWEKTREVLHQARQSNPETGPELGPELEPDPSPVEQQSTSLKVNKIKSSSKQSKLKANATRVQSRFTKNQHKIFKKVADEYIRSKNSSMKTKKVH